ncbi:MAG: site-specific integrase [Dehalococcoidia bacterium]
MKTYLEPDEVAMLEKATSNLRDRLLLRILSRSGCRVSEVLALEVQHVDFNQDTITIIHLKSRIRLSCPIATPGWGKPICFVPNAAQRFKMPLPKPRSTAA